MRFGALGEHRVLGGLFYSPPDVQPDRPTLPSRRRVIPTGEPTLVTRPADVPAELRTLVSIHLEIEPDRLVRPALLGEDLCIDSLAATELTLIIEDEWDIAVADEERSDVRTYGDFEDLVTRLLSEASPS